jgi:hypothetical protein
VFRYEVKELISKVLFFIGLGLVVYGSYIKADQDRKANKVILQQAETR